MKIKGGFCLAQHSGRNAYFLSLQEISCGPASVCCRIVPENENRAILRSVAYRDSPELPTCAHASEHLVRTSEFLIGSRTGWKVPSACCAVCSVSLSSAAVKRAMQSFIVLVFLVCLAVAVTHPAPLDLGVACEKPLIGRQTQFSMFIHILQSQLTPFQGSLASNSTVQCGHSTGSISMVLAWRLGHISVPATMNRVAIAWDLTWQMVLLRFCSATRWCKR